MAVGRRLDRYSLGLQVGVLLTVVLLVLVGAGAALAYSAARTAAYDEAEAVVRSSAVLLARDGTIQAGIRSEDPAAELAEPVEADREAAGLAFVVVMTMDGIRWTHPDPEQIGERYRGSIAPAQAGGIVVEQYVGTLGPSVRAVAPVLGDDGEPIALVAAGMHVDGIHASVASRAVMILVTALAVLAAGAVTTWLIYRRLDRAARGLGSRDIVRTLAQHEALLRSVRAGYVLVGASGRVDLCNDEARRLLGLSSDVTGARIAELGLEPGLAELMASGRESDGEIHIADERTIVVTQMPALGDDEPLGWVTTVADHTEMVRLTGVVESQRTLIDALRARAHEADNRLHTVVVLVELGEYQRAVEFATGTLAHSSELADRLSAAVGDAALVALLLGKSAQAQERGVELRLAEGFELPATSLPAEDLLVILGNLVDNAIDAAADGAEPRWVELRGHPDVRSGAGQDVGVPAGPATHLVLEVADSGPGLAETLVARAFTRGWSTKEPRPGSSDARGIGLSLVRSAVCRLRGRIEVRREQGAVFTVDLPVPEDGTVRDTVTADGGTSR